MEFEYEVSAEDYADALILYYRLNRRRLGAGTGGLFIVGGFLLTVGLIEKEKGLSPLLLVALGAFSIWQGIVSVVPRLSSRKKFRRYFRELGIEGKKSQANINEEGLNITGDGEKWSRPWADISSRGEDKRLFMFYSRGRLLILPKQYLNDEQQQDLRSLAGLP